MTTLSVARQFTEFPGGRSRRISEFSGEQFREEFLEPAVKSGEEVIVELDGVVGYGSSFLEEVFGGIVRAMKWLNRDQVNKHLKIISSRESWLIEANQYIDDELRRRTKSHNASGRA